MKEKKGKIPVDTEISIDFSKKEPKIDFKYPDRNPYEQNKIGYHTVVLMIIFLVIPWMYMGLHEVNYERPNECNLSFEFGNYTSIIFADCNDRNYTIEYVNKVPLMSNLMEGEEGRFRTYDIMGKWEATKGLAIFILTWVILLILFAKTNSYVARKLIKSKWYIERIPKINAFSLNGKMKYKKFLKKDVKRNVIMIPSFSNVVLNYKASGDMGEKLLRIDVLPEDFKHQYYKRGKLVKKKWNIKRNWYALFIFKEEPKNGKLEVWFI